MNLVYLILPYVFLGKRIVQEKSGIVNLTPRPTRYFHGMGASCPKVSSPEAIRKCIETGSGLLGSIKSLYNQAAVGCEQLKSEIFDKNNNVRAKFVNGFHLEGVSQGGMVARLVFHTCHKIRPLVRRILTYGTPNLGIDEFPTLSGFKKVAMKVALTLIKAKHSVNELSNKYSFYQYLNTILTIEDKKHVRLADLVVSLLDKVSYRLRIPNDKEEGFQKTVQRMKNAEIVLEEDFGDEKQYIITESNIYKNLEGMVNVQFTEDEVITPPSSSTFGVTYDPNNLERPFSEFQKTTSNAKSGLRELYEKNRLISCFVKGKHLEYETDEEWVEMFSFLDDDYSKYISGGTKYSLRQLYREAFLEQQKFNLPIRNLVCDRTHKMPTFNPLI